MIGIDVVDLSDPLLKPRMQKHFRFISHPEDDFSQLEEFDTSLKWWFWWAAKEASFKCYRISEKFNPKKIAIRFSNIRSEGSKVLIQFIANSELTGEIEYNNLTIKATATFRKVKSFHTNVFPLCKTSEDSIFVRLKLKQYIKYLYPGLLQHISFSHTSPPVITNRLTNKMIPVSYSHHHKYGGFAIPTSTLGHLSQPTSTSL